MILRFAATKKLASRSIPITWEAPQFNPETKLVQEPQNGSRSLPDLGNRYLQNHSQSMYGVAVG